MDNYLTDVMFMDPQDLWAGHTRDQSGKEHYQFHTPEELGFSSVDEAHQAMIDEWPVTIYEIWDFADNKTAYAFNDGQHRVNFCEYHGLKVPVQIRND